MAETPVRGVLSVFSLHLDHARLDLTHNDGAFVLESDDGIDFELVEALW